MAVLYIVATPIGNLEDITLRALRVLKEVDVVLCEDTRQTRKLLNHYDIKTPTVAYHAHSSEGEIQKILDRLAVGCDVALVTDAGTPGVSDPGGWLVAQVRERLGEDVRIVAVPGPSAVAAAVSLSGISNTEFFFLGFPPHKKGRETFFDGVAAHSQTVIFYESSHRILKALESLRARIPEQSVLLARELTKLHEEVLVGEPAELLIKLTEVPEKQRGEFVVIVTPKAK